jgi:hypothetical protein
MVDGFALLKVLYLNDFTGKVKLVLNQYKTTEAGKRAYASFRSAAVKHLGKEVAALGMIPEDENLTEAVRIQQPLQTAFPGSAAAKCIQKMAERLVANKDVLPDSMNVEGFWRRCFKALHGPLKLPKRAKKEQTETPPSSSKQEESPSESREQKGADAETVSEVSKQAKTGTGQAAAYQRFPSVGSGDEKGQIEPSLPVLERLAESINSVSREIQLIRHTITDNGTVLFHQDVSPKGSYANSLPKPIRLDLDAFLRKLQIERME